MYLPLNHHPKLLGYLNYYAFVCFCVCINIFYYVLLWQQPLYLLFGNCCALVNSEHLVY